jgi:hypothetical protein
VCFTIDIKQFSGHSEGKIRKTCGRMIKNPRFCRLCVKILDALRCLCSLGKNRAGQSQIGLAYISVFLGQNALVSIPVYADEGNVGGKDFLFFG